MFHRTDDLRIERLRPLLPPAILLEEIPLTEQASTVVWEAREAAARILHKKDDRLLVVVGPCSIHDPDAALEYGARLKSTAVRRGADLHIVMRVYFEKPRTTVGWKGLINDPHIDETYDINQGLRVARRLLADLAALGMPAGTEYLDTISPQFIADLVAWGAIGARTTESQVHRELASGLSMPVGFKNGTGGSIQLAVDAVRSARHPHHFLSVTKQGIAAIVATTGNEDCHLILRGASTGPNHDAETVARSAALLRDAGAPEAIMVDFSHGNSRKDHTRQIEVARDVAGQIASGTGAIIGAMIESHLIAGRQDWSGREEAVYGQSITDACVGWDETVTILELLADAVQARRARAAAE
jgi:3-deoxy-7-phosphoheptulonate synthase